MTAIRITDEGATIEIRLTREGVEIRDTGFLVETTQFDECEEFEPYCDNCYGHGCEVCETNHETE